MKKNLKKINKNCFLELDELYCSLLEIEKKQKEVVSSFSFKKKLCCYNKLVVFYYQQNFLNFLTHEQILSENFVEFKRHYYYKNFHNFASLSLNNTKEEIFLNCSDSLENFWCMFGLSYLSDKDLTMPLLLQFRKLRNNFQNVEDNLYEISCFETTNEQLVHCFENVSSFLNQNIYFLVEAFFFRNLLISQCLSSLSLPTFFYNYFIVILSLDWELSFFIDDFQKALSLYQKLYFRFFKDKE
jgi:hypothetical protein